MLEIGQQTKSSAFRVPSAPEILESRLCLSSALAALGGKRQAASLDRQTGVLQALSAGTSIALPAPSDFGETGSTFTIAQGGFISFSKENSDPITLLDSKVEGRSAQLAITAIGGTITLGTTTGVAIDASSPDTDIITGSVSALDRMLEVGNGLTFYPSPGQGEDATIQITLTNLHGSAPSMDTQSLAITVLTAAPIATALTPADIRNAYGFSQLPQTDTGAGQTIAFFEATDDPDVRSEVETFDSEYSIGAAPQSTSFLDIFSQNSKGSISIVSDDLPVIPRSSADYDETTLDIEWAHAIAPEANIVVIEDLHFGGSTEQRARSLGQAVAEVLSASFYRSRLAPAQVAPVSVLSISYGIYNQSGVVANNVHDYAGESNETAYDSEFSASRVAFVAASGDNLGEVAWPSASANVLSVGGTRLSVDASGNGTSEVAWVNPEYESTPQVHNSGAGFGTSKYEPLPFYQAGVSDPVNLTGARITPDVSDVSTTLSEYDRAGWVYGGGTSASAPQWAALIAIADEVRENSGTHLPQFATSASGPLQSQLQEALYYGPAGDFSLNGGIAAQPAYKGYNLMTGLGSPDAANLISYLATWSPEPTFATVPDSVKNGTTFSLNLDIKSQIGKLLNNLEGETVKLSIIKSTGRVALLGQKVAVVKGGVAVFNAVTFKGSGTCVLAASVDGIVAKSHVITVTAGT